MDEGSLLRLFYAGDVGSLNELIDRLEGKLHEFVNWALRLRVGNRIDDWDTEEILESVWINVTISGSHPRELPRPDLKRTSVLTWLIALACREIDRRLGP